MLVINFYLFLISFPMKGHKNFHQQGTIGRERVSEKKIDLATEKGKKLFMSKREGNFLLPLLNFKRIL